MISTVMGALATCVVADVKAGAEEPGEGLLVSFRRLLVAEPRLARARRAEVPTGGLAAEGRVSLA